MVMIRIMLVFQLLAISLGSALSPNGSPLEDGVEASHALLEARQTHSTTAQIEATPTTQEACQDLCHLGPCHWGHCSFLPSLVSRVFIPDLISTHGIERAARIPTPDLEGLRRPPRPIV